MKQLEIGENLRNVLIVTIVVIGLCVSAAVSNPESGSGCHVQLKTEERK